jgi:hypothetical protein
MAQEGTPPSSKGSLRLFARIGAVLGVLAALIPASIALYSFVTRPDPAVADYQKQVLATCNRVRDILSRNHNSEVLNLQSFGPDITINKGGAVQVMTNNRTEVKGEFDLLNNRKTPGSLAEKKRHADQAEQALYDTWPSDIQFVRTNVRDGESVQEFSRHYSSREAADAQVMSRLSAAMSDLASAECRLTGTPAGGASPP